MLKLDQETTLDFEFKNQNTNVPIPKEETADFLNDYFANVGVRIVPNLNRFVDDYTQCDVLNIGNVTELEVTKLIFEIDV